MEFVVKKHNKSEFYAIFCKWLETHKFPIVSDLWLPENVFVCYTNEIPCYCIWFYHNDAKLAHIGFPASNKNVNYKKKQGGLQHLLEYVEKYAKRKGYVTLFTTSNTESVVSTLEKCEYILGDKNVNHFFKII